MPLPLKDVIENTKEIYMTKSSLVSLLDFERVIDELDCYAFANWKKGELVEGPVYEKYFVSCTFMWPYKLMPDPKGGQRLLNFGCQVEYQEDELHFPKKIKDPSDFKPGTKVAKQSKTPIWLVTITMPKSLIMSDE